MCRSIACLWMALTLPAAHAQQEPTTRSTPVVSKPAGTTGSDVAPTPATTRLSAKLAARYPANSIDSVARASAALEDVARTRAQVQAQLANDERACMPTFFTTHCLDQARERRRAALVRLRSIEVEANTYQRRARVEERERALAQKPVKAEPAAPKLPKAALPAAPSGAEGCASTASHAGDVASPPAVTDPRATPAQAVMPSAPRQARPAAPGMSRAAEEANMAAFDRKAAESARRQREIAEKKAEKERDRVSRKASGVPSAAPLPATP